MRRQGQPASLRSRLALLPIPSDSSGIWSSAGVTRLPDSADARPDCAHHASGSCAGPQPQPLWRPGLKNRFKGSGSGVFAAKAHRAIPALSGARGPCGHWTSSLKGEHRPPRQSLLCRYRSRLCLRRSQLGLLGLLGFGCRCTGFSGIHAIWPRGFRRRLESL